MIILSVDVGRKNLALCALQPGDCAQGARDLIRHWTVTACDPTAAGVARALDALPWCAAVDDVVVERQPNVNATMTRLQHYLEMYFSMRGKPVTVQDAKHKLAFAAGTRWWPAAMPDNWTYHTRKKLSVQTTAAFLEDTAQCRSQFAAAAKKDDLADSLLQAMAYCHNVRPLRLAEAQAQAGVDAVVIRPRKPTAAQAASGRYSKPNIVHLLRGKEDVSAALAADKKLAKSVDRQFGGPDAPDLLRSLVKNAKSESSSRTNGEQPDGGQPEDSDPVFFMCTESTTI